MFKESIALGEIFSDVIPASMKHLQVIISNDIQDIGMMHVTLNVNSVSSQLSQEKLPW